jgi:hypothetical protein
LTTPPIPEVPTPTTITFKVVIDSSLFDPATDPITKLKEALSGSRVNDGYGNIINIPDDLEDTLITAVDNLGIYPPWDPNKTPKENREDELLIKSIETLLDGESVHTYIPSF